MKHLNFNKYNESPNELNSIVIHNIQLYQPRLTIRNDLREREELHLRKKFQIGIYTDKSEINEILKSQFQFYSRILDASIIKLNPRTWLPFILFQYELSGKLTGRLKEKNLNKSDYYYWRNNGPIFRQTCDFLCDKIVELNSIRTNGTPKLIDDLYYLDTVWVCSASCIEYSSASNFTYMIMQDSSYLEILPPGREKFLIHGINEESKFNKCFRKYQELTNTDIGLREKYIQGETIEHNVEEHFKLLDEPLKKSFDMSYSEIMYLLTSISINTMPIISPGMIPMVDKEAFINEISHNNNFTLKSLIQVFEAFTLNSGNFKNRSREIWNYRQQNRISKKPFLQISEGTKDFLLWSDQKLKDFLTLLDLDVVFKNFPEKLTNEEVNRAIAQISNKTGKWFENQVSKLMYQLNIFGASVKKINDTETFYKGLSCPIGEIDFLGLSELDSSIVILECKMTNAGFESRSIRQDRDAFLKGKNCYAVKFAKKINWVFDNFDLIKKTLCKKYNVDESRISRRVACSFITYYTTTIPCFFDSIPCPSLVDFVDRYKSKKNWPYINGFKTEKLNIAELASL